VHAELPTDLAGGDASKKADRKSTSRKHQRHPKQTNDKAADRKAALAFEKEQKRRERERAVEWNSYSSRARMPIDCSQLEPGDHLIPWGDGEDVVRYFHAFDDAELASCLRGLPVEPVSRYRADGRGGDQNEYFVFRAR